MVFYLRKSVVTELHFLMWNCPSVKFDYKYNIGLNSTLIVAERQYWKFDNFFFNAALSAQVTAGARRMSEVTLATIKEAAGRIKGYTHLTPVMTCGMIDEMAPGRKLFFKCELLQKTGSFKVHRVVHKKQKCML